MSYECRRAPTPCLCLRNVATHPPPQTAESSREARSRGTTQAHTRHSRQHKHASADLTMTE
eukprot:scaffold192_cov126-Isochrysis_galbana.AAC.1